MATPAWDGAPSIGVGGNDVRTLSLILGLDSAAGVPGTDMAGDCRRGGADGNCRGGDVPVGVSCLMVGPEKLPPPGFLRSILPISVVYSQIFRMTVAGLRELVVRRGDLANWQLGMRAQSRRL
jgi:hypothetical protein